MGVDMDSVQTKMEVTNGGQLPRSKPQACKVKILNFTKAQKTLKYSIEHI